MIVGPKKTKQEQLLFEKYKGWLSSFTIPTTVIRNFKRDVRLLKKSSLILLFSFAVNAQSSIVASGSSNITIGETFPIMQTIEEEKEVTLSTPKFEIPIEQPKIVKKKLTIFDKIINLIKKLFKK